MNILVVNDDSINAYGIKLLAKKLMKYGHVYVVAPHTEQSAIGHGITIHDSMKLHIQSDFLEGVEAWSLEGKPADCVKFALYGLNLSIDLVVSGVNDGPNLGTDIMYSGTLAGASEAIICNVPAIAFSTDFDSFKIVEDEIESVLDKVIDESVLSKNSVINVNFPKSEFIKSKGIKVTEQGLRPFLHKFELEGDVYWARGTWGVIDNKESTDVYAYENGYISITPIQINRTNFQYIKKLKEKFPDLR
ncbi:MAG: 5'/3'-nucleotidase SurE [Clostridiales bacterium]|nr:5'/3'-nucleotidase SurE [Clostridiales bacterium]